MNVEKESKKIDLAIGELVYDKEKLRKAYNYYHGWRDPEQFRHLEENYGIGTPTEVTFNPLVRPHIDRLIGEYLGLNQDLKVTCKDSDTINEIMRDKQIKVNAALHNHLKQYLENNIIASIINKQDATVDPFIQNQLEKIREDITESYVSQFEIAAQNMIKFFKQSRYIDLDNKMQSLLTDLCIGGMGYYRTRPTVNNDNIRLEICNPLDTFVEKNPNSEYLADCRRAVIRKYMSVEDILAEYHPYLKQEHIKILQDSNPQSSAEGSYTYIKATSNEAKSVWDKSHRGILGGLEVHPLWYGNSHEYRNYNLWTVYDVEWIEVDYSTGKQVRHEGTKIGDSIYITKGEVETIRSKDDPNKCRLSINGLFFLDKNGEPNSMILKTMTLQDRFDLLVFYRDNIIASSGTVGDWVDLAFVPQALGVELPERLQKWLAYKKQGMGIIDSSQEGAQMMNTIFNGYDDSLKLQTIQALNLAMQTIQQQVSMVTGVLPEALAQYEQRDAVSNVQLGVRTTLLMTKQIFKAMDVLYKEVNYDMINLAKLVWPDGFTGTIVLGNLNKIVEILPEYYTTTDFDVHIEDSAKSYQNMQALSSMGGELVKAGAADLEDITNIVTANGLTELKRSIERSIAKKKAENDTIGQLQQQVQQYEQSIKEVQNQNKELQNTIQQLQSQVEKNNQQKLKLEAERLEIEKERMRIDKDFKDKTIAVKQQQVEAQVAEIFDSNPYNDKIKSNI